MARAKTVLVALGGLVWLGGAEALADAAAPPVTSTQSVYLAYRELGYNVGTWRIPVTYQPTAFKKEPDLGNRAVLRGTLKFGDSTDAFVPFLWDCAQGKLYLDLNRNQDLTDDADGVFDCMPGQASRPFQFFSKVRLPFKTPMGPQRVLVELLFANDRGQREVSAMANYCWEGRATQAGREWQLALVDNLSFKIGSAEGAYLIARPWADRDRPIALQFGPMDSPLPFPNELFLGERVCQLACVYEPQDDRARMRLDLIERAEPLGELKITGKYIHRLVLSRAGPPGTATPAMAAQDSFERRYALRSGAAQVAAQPPSLTVVLDAPGPVAKVPLGTYSCQISLKQGGVQAQPLFNPAPSCRAVVVSATNAATLTAGGPLTNSVDAERHGRTLSLRYSLLGANGEGYQLMGVRKEPGFTISRADKDGDKKLASGNFQFG